MLYDDPTGIDDAIKQDGLDFIRFNISKMLKFPVQYRVTEETVDFIDLRDIDIYLRKISQDQSLEAKNLLIESVTITDIEQFAHICDYVEIDNVNYPSRTSQKVYFIESADSAITLIPIELDDRSVSIYIEPLESSPDFITELWAINRDSKNNDLQGIKFVNPRDLPSRSSKKR